MGGPNWGETLGRNIGAEQKWKNRKRSLFYWKLAVSQAWMVKVDYYMSTAAHFFSGLGCPPYGDSHDGIQSSACKKVHKIRFGPSTAENCNGGSVQLANGDEAAIWCLTERLTVFSDLTDWEPLRDVSLTALPQCWVSKRCNLCYSFTLSFGLGAWKQASSAASRPQLIPDQWCGKKKQWTSF